MERYKNCNIYVDAEHVRRRAQWIYGSIKEMLVDLGYSRQRYWEIVKHPHRSKYEPCLIDLAKCLDTDVEEITYEG